jgi:hypothetical protein
VLSSEPLDHSCAAGVKLFFFPAPIAEADASGGVKSFSMNVPQMHHKGLPVQKVNDMSFVFSDD